MGLFGIALISISRRTKETGIRKVNGATVIELLYLLNIGFVRWVLVAIIIATPVSIYIIISWMERFAYKTDLSWWIFLLAGISAIVIAILTISWQSITTATRNPAEASSKGENQKQINVFKVPLGGFRGKENLHPKRLYKSNG